MCFGGVEGGKEGEAAGPTACILVPEVFVAAVGSSVRLLCGAHLGLQKIWSGASHEGVMSLSRFQEHHSRHAKDTNVLHMKVLHRKSA